MTLRRLSYLVMLLVLIPVIVLLDYLLKIAIGLLVVYLLWLPTGFSFGRGCMIAGWVLGSCLVGLWGGCDMLLNGYAKRLYYAEFPSPPPPSKHS